MKNKVIGIRLTAKEQKQLKINASELGMSTSRYILWMCIYNNTKNQKIHTK